MDDDDLPEGAERGQYDKETGAQWVNVTPEMARAHPLGKPGLLIYLIAAWFALGAMGQLGFLFTLGFSFLFLALFFLYLLTAVALVLRAPVSVWLVTVSGGLQILLLMMSADIVTVFLAAIHILIIFYILDGDRPNLIYRHRYRSFKKGDE
ncbi:hypothetical protein [Parasulfitobacter algicola]|uniref:Uncharacterized protein n=1 Tax=Parasulfitobacter algicola TaxID=2614809 RepID=A0ABX2ISJ9_9RHOB|nr:hypothetical protein [Sulfitobacter algicola]NSX55877.1 hypothetical protein [Sulfitobacter algicola]